MPSLTNLSGFAVWVSDLGRELAPYETIAVEDEAIVRKAIANGALASDLQRLDADGKQALEDFNSLGSEIAATWHREHGREDLARQAESGEVVKAPEPIKTEPYVDPNPHVEDHPTPVQSAEAMQADSSETPTDETVTAPNPDDAQPPVPEVMPKGDGKATK